MILLKTVVCFVLPFMSICSMPTSGIPIQFADCGPASTLKNVDLSPCTELPCVFHKGQNVTVKIDFSTQGEVTSLKANVYGIVAGIPLPFPLPNANACKNCNLQCPLPANSSETYISAFPVLDTYPEIKLNVKWTLTDENEEDVVCFVFPMQIS